MRKPKLTLKEQIEYMRDKKGILFNIIKAYAKKDKRKKDAESPNP